MSRVLYNNIEWAVLEKMRVTISGKGDFPVSLIKNEDGEERYVDCTLLEPAYPYSCEDALKLLTKFKNKRMKSFQKKEEVFFSDKGILMSETTCSDGRLMILPAQIEAEWFNVSWKII